MLVGAETVHKNWRRYLAIKIAKTFFRWCHSSLGLPVYGELFLALPDGKRGLRFNARNTHFGCLYHPQFSEGYEASSLALLDALVGNGGCFFDVGSNFGYFSLSLAAREGFAGHIHAFEPFSPSFTDLSDLVEGSGLGGLITCHRLALSNYEGMLSLQIDALHSALVRLEAGSGGPETEVARLDSLDLPRVDVIKIDVEGHEAEVLEGAEKTISDTRPAILFESLHLNPLSRTQKPFSYLRERKYVFFLPAWCVEEEGKRFFMDPLPTGNTWETPPKLGLVPFRPEERFLLHQDTNILAWPKERLEGLFHLFDDTKRFPPDKNGVC